MIKKKRGRKPKNHNPEDQIVEEVKVPKKRGRKPKGGKIVTPVEDVTSNVVFKENVILHLKCKIGSTIENETLPENIDFHNINSTNSKLSTLQYDQFQEANENCDSSDKDNDTDSVELISRKQINKKLRELQRLFYNDCVYGKRSACFWCTCEFDNHPIYIPKSRVKSNYNVYGCFCSPECGVSYLMNEMIDTSQKYERYQMMNYIYGTIFDYNNNIKPAPDPHYLLDKFYGNMSIEEYRALLSSQNFVMFIEKPLTHSFPELHDENYEQLSTKDKIIPSSSSFQVKRKSKKVISKNETMMENFGFS